MPSNNDVTDESTLTWEDYRREKQSLEEQKRITKEDYDLNIKPHLPQLKELDKDERKRIRELVQSYNGKKKMLDQACDSLEKRKPKSEPSKPVEAAVIEEPPAPTKEQDVGSADVTTERRAESPVSAPNDQSTAEDLHPATVESIVDVTGGDRLRTLTEILNHVRLIPQCLDLQPLDNATRILGNIHDAVKDGNAEAAESRLALRNIAEKLSKPDILLGPSLEVVQSTLQQQSERSREVINAIGEIQLAIEKQTAILDQLVREVQKWNSHDLVTSVSSNTNALTQSYTLQTRVAECLDLLPERMSSETFARTFVRCTSRVLTDVLMSLIRKGDRQTGQEHSQHLQSVYEMAHVLLTLSQSVTTEVEIPRNVVQGVKHTATIAAAQPTAEIQDSDESMPPTDTIRNEGQGKPVVLEAHTAEKLESISEELAENICLPDVPDVPLSPAHQTEELAHKASDLEDGGAEDNKVSQATRKRKALNTDEAGSPSHRQLRTRATSNASIKSKPPHKPRSHQK